MFSVSFDPWRLRRPGQTDHKCGTAPAPFAGRLDAPAVRLDDVPDDGEAEAKAARPPVRTRVSLAEPLEDMGQDVR